MKHLEECLAWSKPQQIKLLLLLACPRTGLPLESQGRLTEQPWLSLSGHTGACHIPHAPYCWHPPTMGANVDFWLGQQKYTFDGAFQWNFLKVCVQALEKNNTLGFRQ